MINKETYKRLTESGSKYVTNDGEHDIIIKLDKKGYENPQYDYDSICEKLNHLAELEDKIMDGTLVELLCKVGQQVYVPWCWDGNQGIAVVKIEEIKFYCDDTKRFMFFIDLLSDDEDFNQNFGYWKTEQSIGKTIFLTKAEAEARLKELQEKQK